MHTVLGCPCSNNHGRLVDIKKLANQLSGVFLFSFLFSTLIIVIVVCYFGFIMKFIFIPFLVLKEIKVYEAYVMCLQVYILDLSYV